MGIWTRSASRMLLSIMVVIVALMGVSGCGQVEQRPSTATPNVSVLPYPFLIPGLDRQRTVRLYLPLDYDNETQSYPVIYMHDGQNLFGTKA